MTVPAVAATSSTLTVASPAAPHAGDKLTFAWTTDSPNAKNWIGVYGPASSPSTSSSWVWSYVTSGTSGSTTVNTSGLAGGPYTAYLLFDDGSRILAQSDPITFAGTGDSLVITSSATPHEGQKTTLAWSTGTPNAKNWVGVYDGDRQPGNGSSIAWAYTAAASGTLTLDTSGLTGGPYTAYLLFDDTYPVLARSAPFSFTPVVAPHEAVDAVTVPATTGDRISVPLGNLWIRPDGNKPGTPSYRRISGDSWLSVSASGEVTGTVPAAAPKEPGRIVVGVRDSAVGTDTVTVVVPVRDGGQDAKNTAKGKAGKDGVTFKVATLNLWDAGAHVDGPLEKQARVVLTQGLDIVALQETGGTAARTLGQALGWNVYQSSGSLGIVSRYPLTRVTGPTAALPAVSATVTLPDGSELRLWVAQLDEADYGPDRELSGLTADGLVAAEKLTLRYRQAQQLALAMKSDLASATPVVLAAGLASPSHLDWISRTAYEHNGLGPVAWPVTKLLEKAGLTDAFREANAGPIKAPGITWSPVHPAQGGDAEPQDRIDQVQYSGGLEVVEAHSLVTGRPLPVPGTGANGWPSDHAAAVATFALRNAR
ncbi:endonuclease/exonuclease/phosphatase family protein [Actinacidiphila yeochonensis]|uniref:endonuclease/exonuclease/phosphatase family protein n=1 Tax=Actinacidiphila yeochonensis TaxID=89050 RepID=UPI00055EF137|nr:endonuclease/exonuclease/phosphatase family protein [Actinacidiphila yeochonensis]